MPSPSVHKYFKMPPVRVRQRCLDLVLDTAQRYGIPPAHVTAHIRTPAAVAARREVQVGMLAMGLKRVQIAEAFGVDLRRVRASVIGSPGCQPPKDENRRRRRPSLDYSTVDLFGEPLHKQPQRRRPERRTILNEAVHLLSSIAGGNPQVAEWMRRNANKLRVRPL